MKILRWLIAAVSLALVIGVAQWESRELTSPGDLHPSHADVAALQGAEGCIACHSASSMAPACNVCHTAIESQVRDARGVHGWLDSAVLDACDECHREHSGGTLALVADLSFQSAGLGAMHGFDHHRVAPFDLGGRHDAIECSACHRLAAAPQLLPGERRFLGLTQRCATCHEDPHQGALGAACVECHGQEHAFAQAAGFVHDEAFPLRGGHAGLDCVACHDPSGPDLIGSLRASRVAAHLCADCHRSPHRAEFMRAVAATRRTGPDEACTLCHEAAHAGFLGPDADMPRELHAATGFPLAPPHDTQACDECHAQYGRRQPLADGGDLAQGFAVIFPGRSPTECRACHGDPHAGQFDGGPTGGRCTGCHAAARFVPSTFDIADHARGRFPLTGAHQAVGCNDCHEMEGGHRRFVPTPSACADCHQDPHGGRFDAGPRTVDGGEGCARCHATSIFTEVHWSSEAHRQWSGYRLNGAHARVSCLECHRREGRTGDFGVDTPSRECASCHADPHAGQFNRSGRTSCARCHGETERFSEIRFDHQHDSRFALDEHHRTLSCAACHRPVTVPGRGTVVRYRPLGTECRDCHGTMTPAKRP